MKTTPLRYPFLALLLAGGIAVSSHAQILVDEDFSGGFGNWSAGNGTLDSEFGNPAGSVQHPGGAVSEWTASSLSVNPMDAPFVLTADIYDSGAAGTNTVGFRTDATPLFEMGHYEHDHTATGGGNDNYKVRIVNFANNDNWILLSGGTIESGEGPVGWNRWQATFDSEGVTVTLDIGITGTIDYSYTSVGSTPGPFTSLRIGGASDILTANSSVHYDNIRLEIIPEPSTYAAIFGFLALAGALARRRLKSKA